MYGSVPEAYGSCTLRFGEEDTQIVCAIKAEVMKPLQGEPDKGQVSIYLESTQTGRSLFSREDQQETTKQRLSSILKTLQTNVIDRKELSIFAGQYCWYLHVDILVFAELSMDQLDYISLCLRQAFVDLQLPQTIATVNSNTGAIEIGLVEDVYTDKQNTDKPVRMVSAASAPYLVSLGIVQLQKTHVLHDATSTELSCLDQVLHLSVDRNLKIHGMQTTVGALRSDGQMAMSKGLPASVFLETNLLTTLKERVEELERLTAV